jgi:hypothetical protein
MTAASVKSSEQQGPLCSLTSLLMYPDDCTARCMVRGLPANRVLARSGVVNYEHLAGGRKDQE